MNIVCHVDFLDLNIVSKPYNAGNKAEIVINGVDYAVNERGLNIVVYDFEMDKVIDSVAFDTHVSNYICTRNREFLDKEDLIRVDLKKLRNSIKK